MMEQQSTRYEGEPKINQKVEIVSSPEKIIASETKRVKWYLDNLSKYEEMGYPLTLPKGLTSESLSTFTIFSSVKDAPKALVSFIIARGSVSYSKFDIKFFIKTSFTLTQP